MPDDSLCPSLAAGVDDTSRGGENPVRPSVMITCLNFTFNKKTLN